MMSLHANIHRDPRKTCMISASMFNPFLQKLKKQKEFVSLAPMKGVFEKGFKKCHRSRKPSGQAEPL